MATITKTAEAQPLGKYVPTGVDAAKAAADIRIVGYFRKRTEIESRRNFSGVGVKLEKIINGIGRYLVTDEALTELRRRYTIATDF